MLSHDRVTSRVIGMETPRRVHLVEGLSTSAATELSSSTAALSGGLSMGSCPVRRGSTAHYVRETGTIEVCGDRLLHHDHSERVSGGSVPGSQAERAAFPGACYYADDLENAGSFSHAVFIRKNCLEASIRRLARLTSGGGTPDISLSDCWRIAPVLDGGKGVHDTGYENRRRREFCRGTALRPIRTLTQKWQAPPNKNRARGKQETLKVVFTVKAHVQAFSAEPRFTQSKSSVTGRRAHGYCFSQIYLKKSCGFVPYTL